MTDKSLAPVTALQNIVEGADILQAHARTRVNLAVINLMSACQFSRELRTLELSNKGNDFGPFWEEIYALAAASVFLTVAALEAFVNEAFADHDQNFPAIPRAVFLKLWEAHEQKPMLDKYDLALLVRNSQPINRGTSPAQDVQLLVRLRNALVHFKPEWFDSPVEHDKLSKQLAGRFAPSPFFGKVEPLFPRSWATHGCSVWAIRMAINFIEDFEQQAAFPSSLAKFKPRLTP